MVHAGRQIGTADFLEDPQPAIFTNINLKYGYMRLRANATTLITEVQAAGCSGFGITAIKNLMSSIHHDEGLQSRQAPRPEAIGYTVKSACLQC